MIVFKLNFVVMVGVFVLGVLVGMVNVFYCGDGKIVIFVGINW